MLEKYKTNEEIKKVMEARLNSLIELLNNQNLNYPFKARILGFPMLEIKDRDELIGRTRELCDLLGLEPVEEVTYPEELQEIMRCL